MTEGEVTLGCRRGGGKCDEGGVSVHFTKKELPSNVATVAKLQLLKATLPCKCQDKGCSVSRRPPHNHPPHTHTLIYIHIPCTIKVRCGGGRSLIVPHWQIKPEPAADVHE